MATTGAGARRLAVTNTFLVTQIRARDGRGVTKADAENKNRLNNQGDSRFPRQIQRDEKRAEQHVIPP